MAAVYRRAQHCSGENNETDHKGGSLYNGLAAMRNELDCAQTDQRGRKAQNITGHQTFCRVGIQQQLACDADICQKCGKQNDERFSTGTDTEHHGTHAETGQHPELRCSLCGSSILCLERQKHTDPPNDHGNTGHQLFCAVLAENTALKKRELVTDVHDSSLLFNS